MQKAAPAPAHDDAEFNQQTADLVGSTPSATQRAARASLHTDETGINVAEDGEQLWPSAPPALHDLPVSVHADQMKDVLAEVDPDDLDLIQDWPPILWLLTGAPIRTKARGAVHPITDPSPSDEALGRAHPRVDPSVHTLEVALRRLRLDTAGERMRKCVGLLMGSLTYGDRRWQGLDASRLLEVIEHLDRARNRSCRYSRLRGPGLVVLTTPNRAYNAQFEGMAEGALGHPDHSFEWTQAEFEAWGSRVSAEHGYAVAFQPIGPLDDTHGAPSQMAVFTGAAEGPA